MKKILIITGRYLPGYKDGGPVRTIKNLTDILGDKYQFTVMCADRDHGDTSPYDGIETGVSTRVGKAFVYYVKDGNYTFSQIRKLSGEHDLVYVCGPYNNYAIKAMLLNRLGLIKCPFVLAPMGSFSKGALAIRSTKKQIFLSLIKGFGLFKKVAFSVTSDVEMRELKDALLINNKCYIAQDPQREPQEYKHETFKKDGKLNVVFLSRICEKKNLFDAIKILEDVKGNVNFTIYGNIEDQNYYDKCMSEAQRLPDNISVTYGGTLNSEEVPKVLSGYDVFLFPTHGENFGHVISEALLSGVIPVISDTTPWLDFDKYNAGRVISLSNKKEFSNCIDSLCEADEKTLKEMSDNAYQYYTKKYIEASNNNGYMEMFDELLR